MTYYVTVSALYIDQDSLIRADGVVMGRLVTEDDIVYIEVKDRDRLRSEQRGTQFVRIQIDAFGELAGDIDN